jgi:hypothetical protein
MDAAKAFLPICTWRTMFSRTTMASSISKPTHRDSAIKFTIYRLKPSGSAGDGDIFGAQQYAPLLDLEIPG